MLPTSTSGPACANNKCSPVLPTPESARAPSPDPQINKTSDLSTGGPEANQLKGRDVQPSAIATSSSPQPGTAPVLPYISDPLIEQVNSALGTSEVERLIKLRKSRRPQNRREMTAIMDKQKQNLSIALKEIEKNTRIWNPPSTQF